MGNALLDNPQTDIALYGRDDTPGIIDVQFLRSGSQQNGSAIRIYQRIDRETVTTAEVPFYPFFYLSDVQLLNGMSRDQFQFKQLEGDNFYRYLVVFNEWNTMWEAVRHVKRATNSEERLPDELYLTTDPVQQFLLQSGKSCFLDMTFDDLHRLQLDIEVYTESGFPSAEREEDEIVIIALSDNRGWTTILSAKSMSEKELLGALVNVIQQKNPDVIEGHNIFSFDLDYIRKRCELHNVSLAIGRDGSTPRTFNSSMRFAERSVDFPAMQVAGRHIIDTYFLVMNYDVFKRDLPGYGLKTVARYFNFASDDRTYVEGDDISQTWKTNPDKLLDYALDDVLETERLARHLSGSTFYLTQMLPMPYGQAARTGPAAKIEALFVREYLRERESLPRSEWGSQSMGGYTDIFVTGVVGPVVYADVESLYPSIMLEYDVKPEGDSLNLFPRLLRRLTDLRLDAKKEMKEAQDEEIKGELDARQSSYKVLINSFYGNLGFSLAAFNDFSEADRVARIGQQLLRKIISEIRRRGGTVVEVDTDGVFFIPPDDIRGEATEKEFTRSLTDALPEGIRVGFDGRYEKMLSYKKKNYALRRYDGTLKFKGSSLISRSNEPFGRRFVRQAINHLLDEDIAALHDLYLDTRRMIEEHDWPQGVDSFKRTETLKDTVADYEQAVEAGKRPRAASYELAIERSERTGQPVRKGDRISYYITGNSANLTAFENCKLAEEWSLDNPDENTAYYLHRLDQFADKFDMFFDEHDFRQIFSPEDLFGFSAEDIEIKNETREPEPEVEDDDAKVPF